MPSSPPEAEPRRASSSLPCQEARLQECTSFYQALVRLLMRIEESSEQEAGALSLVDLESGEVLGLVMAEKGRLCWATARDSAVSLGRSLAEATGMPREELASLYEKCRQAGKPLGETLVSQGLLNGEQLRELLGAQIGACLSTLLRASLEAGTGWSDWLAAPGRSYLPSFTFRSDEVVDLVLAADLEVRLGMPRVPEPFRELVERCPLAACLLVLDARDRLALPVARGSSTLLSLTEMTALFRAGLSLLRSPALAAAGEQPYMTFLLAEEGEGGLGVACSPCYVFVVQFDRISEFVPLISHLRRDRRFAPAPA